jgi:hypothetical protein
MLSSLIKAKRLGGNPAGMIEDNDALTSDCDAIAAAVVEHIAAAGVVTVPALGIVAPPGTAGGPCTGVATGTIA